MLAPLLLKTCKLLPLPLNPAASLPILRSSTLNTSPQSLLATSNSSSTLTPEAPICKSSYSIQCSRSYANDSFLSWVFSTVTPSSQSAGHNKYNPSTGTKLNGYTWKIGYGDGSGASGTVYKDRVVVGGVTATSQAVEAATSVSSSFSSGPEDGLLGLAFSSINTVSPQKQTTFFDTVKSSLSSPLFTVSLQKGKAGAYTFGYVEL